MTNDRTTSPALRDGGLEPRLTDREWLLDAPPTADPGFRAPRSLLRVWQVAGAMESEVIRLMVQGPPRRPTIDISGAFIIAHLRMLYPTRWIDWFERVGLPDSQISEHMLRAWAAEIDEGAGTADGHLISRDPFAVNDPGWTLFMPSYVALLLNPARKADFAESPAQLQVADSTTLSFVLSGGSGASHCSDGDQRGTTNAALEQIAALDVDYTIDLGGVYYLGQSPWEERFLEQWVKGRRGSFTLNSAHSMYGWGKGYFEQAMSHPTFEAQQGTSYFSIEFGRWMVVGLDTAYYDESPFFASGALRDEAQKAFLRQMGRRAARTGEKVILLTHHRGLSLDGTRRTDLWNDIAGEDALGRAPEYWYWGQERNGVAYSTSSASGTGTRARLAGHGGLPSVAPWVLDQHVGPGKSIEMYAHTPLDEKPPGRGHRVANGFAAVTLTRDALHEQFLDQNGRSQVIGDVP